MIRVLQEFILYWVFNKTTQNKTTQTADYFYSIIILLLF